MGRPKKLTTEKTVSATSTESPEVLPLSIDSGREEITLIVNKINELISVLNKL